MSIHHDPLIQHLETASNAAMPALITQPYDGWVLRFAAGYTRRANSVHPLYSSSLALDEKIRTCEAQYQAQQLPVIFKLTSASIPSDLDTQLEQRGYRHDALTCVQTCDLPANLDPVPLAGQPALSHEWLSAYQTLNDVPSLHHATLSMMLTRIPHATWYAALRDDTGAIVALGLGVLQDTWLGIFDIVVAAQARQRGLGRRIMHLLLTWGQQQGAQQAYLQVGAQNQSALALYHSLGFQTRYHYWYRILNH